MSSHKPLGPESLRGKIDRILRNHLPFFSLIGITSYLHFVSIPCLKALYMNTKVKTKNKEKIKKKRNPVTRTKEKDREKAMKYHKENGGLVMKLSLLIAGVTGSQVEYKLVYCPVETKMTPMLHR